jgi:hypothetical protein
MDWEDWRARRHCRVVDAGQVIAPVPIHVPSLLRHGQPRIDRLGTIMLRYSLTRTLKKVYIDSYDCIQEKIKERAKTLQKRA